jgi:hypothetical protein
MKLNLQSIIMLLAIGGLLLFGITQGCSNQKKQKQIETLQARLDNCLHAPVVTDTIIDSIRIPGKVIVKPVPVRVVVYDTILVPMKESWYDSTFNREGIKFRWASKVHGDLDWIEFSEFTWPRETITISKVVDTCFDKPPEYLPKNHIGAYVGLFGNNIKQFPGVDAGLWVTFRDRWGIKAGAMYNGYHNEVYGQLGASFFFK